MSSPRPPRLPSPNPLRYIAQTTRDNAARRTAAMAGAMAGYAAAARGYDAGAGPPPLPGMATATTLPTPLLGPGGPPPIPGMPQTALPPPGPLGGMGASGMGGGPSSPAIPPPMPAGLALPPPGSPSGGGPGAIPLAGGGPVPADPMIREPVPSLPPPPDAQMGGGELTPESLTGLMQQFMDSGGMGPGAPGGGTGMGLAGMPPPAGMPPGPALGQSDLGMPPDGQEGAQTGSPAPQAFIDWLESGAASDPSPFAADLVRLYQGNPGMADDLWAMVLALVGVGDPEVPPVLTRMTGLSEPGAPAPSGPGAASKLSATGGPPPLPGGAPPDAALAGMMAAAGPPKIPMGKGRRR